MEFSKALASFLESVLALGGPILCAASCCDQSKLVSEPQSKCYLQGSLLLASPSYGSQAGGVVSPAGIQGSRSCQARALPGRVGGRSSHQAPTSSLGGTTGPRRGSIRMQGLEA